MVDAVLRDGSGVPADRMFQEPAQTAFTADNNAGGLPCFDIFVIESQRG